MTPTVISKVDEILAEARNHGEWFTVYGVSWDEYIELLDNTPEQRYPKFTYHNGVLKIMGKQGFFHESTARFLQTLIMTTAFFLKRKTIATGSMSLVSKRLSKGADPDESFYIQNAHKTPNKKTLFDETKDTPPDLVVEVDESSKSSEKFTIYAEFGIKEFWRHDKNTLKIYELDDSDAYREIEQSIAFPVLTTEILNKFLQRRADSDQFEALVEFEAWLREQQNQ